MRGGRNVAGMRRASGAALAIGTLALTLAVTLALATASAAVSPKTERLSISAEGKQTGGGFDPSISAGGRFVAFESTASDLVRGDTNGRSDIFVRDRRTGKTERVSVSSSGRQANRDSSFPSISANGRFVAFESAARNLVGHDSNGAIDVFVHDRKTGKTERVSVSSAGGQANGASASPAISADGGSVAFLSVASNLVPADTNHQADVFVHDLGTGKTERVSVSSAAKQGNSTSVSPSISAGGRFVAFESLASNLVQHDTNNADDVFVHDRKTGKTERVSVDSNGVQGNSFSNNSAISAGGRFVAFDSNASNLVPGDMNNTYDVFVHDRKTGKTERVSVGPANVEGNNSSFSFHLSVSADGRFVAFASDASNLVSGDMNNTRDVFVRDRQSNTTERVSVDSAGIEGNGLSDDPAMSADGRFVALDSSAANLVTDDTNGAQDVFVRDRKNGTTERSSVSSAHAQANDRSFDPAISADGNIVAFGAAADNLVTGDTNTFDDVFVHPRVGGQTKRISVSSAGAQGIGSSEAPSLSAGGRFVAFYSNAGNLVTGDTNGVDDVFVRDRKTGKTERVSVSSAGVEGDKGSQDPSISADGRFVAFTSRATTLLGPGGDTNAADDIFVRDRKTGKTKRVSVSSTGVEANGFSNAPSISADGRFVAFASGADNLVTGDGNHAFDVFVYDRQTGKTKRVSVSSAGVEGNGGSGVPSISADGRFVAFQSDASNLVPGDMNNHTDVFVYDQKTHKTKRVSLSSAGVEGGAASMDPSISGDGRFVAFQSFASNLVANDMNNTYDIFVRDRKTGKTSRVSVSSHGDEANLGSSSPATSADGRFVVFTSVASNLVGGDTNGVADIFVRGPLP